MKGFAKKSLCGILLTAGLLLVLAPVQAAEPAKADYSGSLRLSHDYRALGEYDDSDAYAYWYLRGRNLADKRVEIYTSGRLNSDLDGSGSSYADDPFISLEDTSLKDSVRVLQLYLELHDRKNTMALRAGRQYVDIADYIQMDGLQAMLFENQKLGGRVFLGQPVSYYSSIDGDLFGGASLVGKPWQGNRSRATYARYQDDSEGAADDHYFFDVRQQLMEEVRSISTTCRSPKRCSMRCWVCAGGGNSMRVHGLIRLSYRFWATRNPTPRPMGASPPSFYLRSIFRRARWCAIPTSPIIRTGAMNAMT